MATAIQVFGHTIVKVGTGTVGALETLGECRNQADVIHQPYMVNVHGDANGGDEGPPIDIQVLGEIVLVRLELTKYDSTVAAKILARVRGGTAGNAPTPGVLMFQGSYYTRLLLHAESGPINFPIAVVRGPNEYGVGLRYSLFTCEFECHRNPSSNLLYDASTT